MKDNINNNEIEEENIVVMENPSNVVIKIDIYDNNLKRIKNLENHLIINRMIVLNDFKDNEVDIIKVQIFLKDNLKRKIIVILLVEIDIIVDNRKILNNI